DAHELQGQQVAALGFGIGRREVRRQVRGALQTAGHWQGEVRTSRKDGSLYTCWAAVTQQRDAGGTVTHYIGILNDITQFREVETVARLGGDEYAVLLPGADAAGAELVASKLLERLAEPCMVQGHELSMTMSIGIACYPSDGDDYEILSRNADTAMYRAKHEG